MSDEAQTPEMVIADKFVDIGWNNTTPEKVWGLMQVWGTVKYNFVFLDQRPDLDWDAAVRSAIPHVLEAVDREEYYRRLGELTALLHDGHTMVLSPALFNGEYDQPPVEFQVVEERILLVRTGDTGEIEAQGIHPGLELVAIGEGVPARDYLEQNVLRYRPMNTKHHGEAFGMLFLLSGPKNSTVQLSLQDVVGEARMVTLTRNSQNRDGTLFQPRALCYSPLVESKMLHDGIAYLRISSFRFDEVVKDFNAEFDKLDLGDLPGMILDIRYSMGGNSLNAYRIVERLIDSPVLGSTWTTREYRPAFASWGIPGGWFQGDTVRIEPPTALKRYSGPLVVLIGPITGSASEDFLVPLDYAGRALLIGETTAGSTGNPVMVTLPGGALLRVCSLHATYPDGAVFVGRGIEPDVMVHPSVAGIRAGRDEVLEKAVEMLGNWGEYEGLTKYRRAP
jgi:C-terminal processing protease CtpA/Prc